MKTRHITTILDQTDFAALSGDDLAAVNAHISHCRECRQAFQAARISSVLLKTAAFENSPAPKPFFQQKVLNAWREKQAVRKPIEAFYRWWQASSVLVFIMLLMVGGLIAFSIMLPPSASPLKQTEMTVYSLYSTDSIILNQKTPEDLTIEQAFEVLESSKNNSYKIYDSRK